jgi:ribulose-bisphosphate carboxylase large chain
MTDLGQHERILATYLVETPIDLGEAAAAIAGEQSSGTFLAIPGETEELRQRFRAVVERIELDEIVASPSLPGARVPSDGRYRRGRVTVSWPVTNVGTNLPTLMTTLCGNLSELREVSGIRLLDLEIPRTIVEAYPGPQFGVAGSRALTGVVPERPLFGTIVKPSVGLTPEQTAENVRALAEAGIDFVKDDELIANPPWSPVRERIAAVQRVIEDASDRTGKKVMYAYNITDDLDAMRGHHDAVVEAGGTCVMVSLNTVGLVGVHELRRHAAVPIHGHRNGWGMLTRHPWLGMEFAPYQVLWRLVGVDQLHVSAIQGKFWESDESVARSIRACLEPIVDESDRILPVLSSGQWGGQAPETYRLTETLDLLYLAGGGITAHPQGPQAGLAAIRQAWTAAVEGVPLETYARSMPELQVAIGHFGTVRKA